ncbi:MAG TPA: crosslink repair DNA glycosylase YcaQ family protein [Terriglobales bacterium]|nr:crosslink repair DNA glycosylase YcaQ family protein [Terriglobales bacterium]
MTDQELEQLRRERWHLDGKPVRTLDEARSFVEEVGFCLMYPVKPPVLVPTFVGAWTGSDDRLPTWQHAFADPRAKAASELMVRLLRERDAYEANVLDENNNFLVAASVFPYFYALVGERNPKQPPKPGSRSGYSQLACDAFAIIQRSGPLSKQKLRHTLGGEISTVALDRALNDLWSRLRITRVDYSATEGASWDVLYRWSPDVVREAINLSVPEALTALISKYLDSVVAGEPGEVENFFGNLISRSKIRDAIKALLSARELSFARIGHRTLLEITQEKPAFSPNASTINRPVPEARPRRRPSRWAERTSRR